MTPPAGRVPSTRPVELDDLCRLRWPIEPALRPDGTQVAYVVSGLDPETDRLSYQTFIQPTAGGPARRVRTTSETANDRRPTWSPDGQFLALLTETPTGDRLDVIDVGDAARVVHSPRVLGAVTDFDWSPDSRQLVVLHRSDSDSSQSSQAVSVVGLDGTGPTRPTSELAPGLITKIGWRPGTSQIALISNEPSAGGNPPTTSLVVFDFDAASGDALVRWPGPISAMAWSPDGSMIGFLGHPDGPGLFNTTNLWTVRTDSADGPINLTATYDRSIGQAVRGDDERGIGPPSLAWSADGQRLFAVVAVRGRIQLAAFVLDGGRETIADGDRAILDFAISVVPGATEQGQPAAVVSWSDPQQPGELSYLAGGTEVVLTGLNSSWLSEVDLCDTTAITAQASGDAPLVDGWITFPRRPADPTPVPLVVQIHGGPHYPVGFRFSFDAQRLAAAGIAVMRCNPRGSHGYGHDFAAAIRGDWAGVDFADIVALTDRALTCPGIDPSRLGIVGESYGGYMANWAVGHTDRFAAAIAENGISDLVPLARGPRGPDFWCVEFDADPLIDPTPFIERSPIGSAASIDTPLLLLHAEDDDNCPIAQSQAMHAALVDLDKPVALVTVPGEGHMVNVFGRLSSRIARTAIFDNFLHTHLLDGQHQASVAERGTRQS